MICAVCAVCSEPAIHRVQNIRRRDRAVILDRPLCGEHVQAELTLASIPGLGMTDIEILPLEERPS